MILSCHVDERTLAILQLTSRTTGRTVEDLAEAAISEAACGVIRAGTITDAEAAAWIAEGLIP